MVTDLLSAPSQRSRPMQSAVSELAGAGLEERGAVYTKRHVAYNLAGCTITLFL